MVSLQKFGRVYVLTVIGDGEHRFTEQLCLAITDALEIVHNAEDAGALVTTNEGKFFGNGLDMNWMRTTQRGQGSMFRFRRMFATLLSMNVPTIAAIRGHASAAGFIFALAHDHRCMRADRGYLYMSEMDVKVRLTKGTLSIIRATLSPKAFKDVLLLARKLTAKDALEIGAVDSIHENSAKTLEAAIAMATELSNRGWDRSVYRNIRLDMKPGLLETFIGEDENNLYVQHPSKL